MKKPVGIINQDKNFIDFLPDGECFYRKNMILFKNSLENEDGVIENPLLFNTLNGSLPAKNINDITLPALSPALNWKLIGSIETSSESIFLFFYSTTGGYQAIVEFVLTADFLDEGYFNLILRRQDLNFNQLFPITGTYTFNNLNKIILVFTDNNNAPRFINLSTYQNNTPVNNLFLFPSFNTSAIFQNIQVINGGNLEAGAYVIYLKYLDETNFSTNWSINSKNIYITDDSESGSETQFDGCIEGTICNKAINITLSNLDTNYKFFKIGLLKEVNGIKKAVELSSLYSTNTTNITVSSDINSVDISIDELLQINQTYNKVKTFSFLNDTLFGGNVSIEEELNYQPYANNITTEWYISELLEVGSKKFNDAKAGNLSGGFMPEEVYAFYISLIKNDGTYTPAFHIPGRENFTSGTAVNAYYRTAYDMDNVTFRFINSIDRSDINNSNSSNVRRFHVEDMVGNVLDKRLCYWENENELYDASLNDFKTSNGITTRNDLSGQKVKHHKFPSHTFIVDNWEVLRTTIVGGSDSKFDRLNYGVTFIPILGITFKNVQLSNFSTKIKGVEFFNAKRNSSNSTVLGMTDWWLGNFTIGDNLTNSRSSRINVNSGTVPTECFIMNKTNLNDLTYDNNFKKVYSSGYTFRQYEPIVNPYRNLSPKFLFKDYVGFPSPKNVYTVDVKAKCLNKGLDTLKININNNTYLSCQYVLKITNPVVSGTTISSSVFNGLNNTPLVGYSPEEKTRLYEISTRNRYFKILENEYSNANSINQGKFLDSLYNEAHQDLTLESLADIRNFTLTSCDLEAEGGIYELADDFEEKSSFITENYTPTPIIVTPFKTFTYPSFVKNFLLNAYQNFYNQDLQSIEKFNTIATQYSSSNGDSFICVSNYSTKSARVQNAQDNNLGSDETSQSTGHRFVFRIMLNSNINYNMIYETTQTDTLGNNVYGLYYPKTEYNLFLPKIRLDTNQNKFNLNTDFSSKNNIVKTNTYNPFAIVNLNFPFRVIKSLVVNRETNINNFRAFLVNSYYECVKDKGEIINLQALGSDRLIIHHRNSLFVTRAIGTLNISDIQATIGTSDIFSFPPQEILTSQKGYAGTQHQIACKLTDFGYVFVDAEQGNVFIFNTENGLKLITNGLKNFFTEYITDCYYLTQGESNKYAYDNPYNSIGISLAVDINNKYKRILFNFTNKYGKSFTISYIPYLNEGQGGWFSFHDYKPSILLNNRSNLISFNKGGQNSKLFVHNKGPKGQFYSDNGILSIFSSFTDEVVTNFGSYETNGIIKNPIMTMLNSLVYELEIEDSNGVPLFNDNIDSISVRSENQHTGEITLQNYINILSNNNVRKTNKVYSFDSLYNILVNNLIDKLVLNIENDFNIDTTNIKNNILWFEKKRMKDFYFIVRLKINNTNNKRYKIHALGANSQISFR